jgi:hypothetical protein
VTSLLSNRFFVNLLLCCDQLLYSLDIGNDDVFGLLRNNRRRDGGGRKRKSEPKAVLRFPSISFLAIQITSKAIENQDPDAAKIGQAGAEHRLVYSLDLGDK